MTAFLTIRAFKRYAARQPIWLRKSDGLEVTGLLIELSTEGCRISNLGCAEFSTGESVAVEIGKTTLSGRVRWMRQGVAGIRLNIPLRPAQLNELLGRACLREPAARYGT